MAGCSDFGGGRSGCRLLRLAAGVPAGPVRARQLAWVVGELHRWRPEEPDCVGLLTGDLDDYLAAAGAGKLRTRARHGAPASTASSERVRRTCLSRLGAAGGAPVLLGPGSAPGRVPADAAQVRKLLSWLGRHPAPVAVRADAVAGLASSGLRVGEAADLRVGQVSVGVLREVVRTSPGPGSSWVEDVAVSRSGRRALGRWLDLRETLVASVRVEHVFVGLAGSRSTQGPRGAGWPVSERSLDRAHRLLVGEFLAGHNPTAVAPLTSSDLTLTRVAAAAGR